MEEEYDYRSSIKSYDPDEFELQEKLEEKYSSKEATKRDLSFAELIEEVKRLRENVASKK